jgi:hypothetical protein
MVPAPRHLQIRVHAVEQLQEMASVLGRSTAEMPVSLAYDLIGETSRIGRASLHPRDFS